MSSAELPHFISRDTVVPPEGFNPRGLRNLAREVVPKHNNTKSVFVTVNASRDSLREINANILLAINRLTTLFGVDSMQLDTIRNGRNPSREMGQGGLNPAATSRGDCPRPQQCLQWRHQLAVLEIQLLLRCSAEGSTLKWLRHDTSTLMAENETLRGECALLRREVSHLEKDEAHSNPLACHGTHTKRLLAELDCTLVDFIVAARGISNPRDPVYDVPTTAKGLTTLLREATEGIRDNGYELPASVDCLCEVALLFAKKVSLSVTSMM